MRSVESFSPRKQLSYIGAALAGVRTNRVKVSGGHFVDAKDGRVLMFRGKVQAVPDQTYCYQIKVW